MLKLRVREHTPAGVRGKWIRTVKDTIEFTEIENAPAQLSFSVSVTTSERLTTPFVAGIEYAIGDGKFVSPPENNLFLMEEDSGDDADPSKTVTYRGVSYIPWLMDRNFVWWYGPHIEDNVRTFGKDTPQSAAEMLYDDLLLNQDSGWAPYLTLGFTKTHDSNGQAWVADDKIKDLQVRLPMQTLQFVDQLATQGLCEWSTSGLEFRLFRPGTHRDRTEIVLGAGMARIPVKTDSSALFTMLSVIPSEGETQLVSVPDADMRFGKLDASITMDGVSDPATAARLARPHIEIAQRPAREEAYEWTPTGNGLFPWRDVRVRDMVTARARGGNIARRVIGLIVRETSGSVTVQARVGERIGSFQSQLARRLQSVSVGGMVGGSGASFPGTVGRAEATPEAPNGLTVASNVGRWLDDGSAESSVDLSWAAVTKATDGSEITIDHYEVHSRLPSGVLALDTTVGSTGVEITSWTPGVLRLVAVYAVSSKGVRSAASLELPVTPAVPASVVPKAPTGLAASSNVGSFTAAGPVATVGLSWGAVTQSTDDEALTVAGYEVFVDGVPFTRVTGTTVSLKLATDVAAAYRVRAFTEFDVVGDLSAAVTVTGAKPAVVVRNPTAPVLTTGAGNAFARWDGTYVSGGTLGAHRVDVEARIGAGAWVVQGTLVGAGQQIIKIGVTGDTVAVRLRAYDQLGRLTGTSAEATVTVVGIEIPDLDQSVSDMLADMETDISGALGAANAAQGTANTAKTNADQALADALAAANAASAAQTTANAKGKTIIQSAAPAVADRLPQNLWIDTTGGANTPKRWTTGTTWVAVTDKAATDAAAAAVTAKNAADTAQARADSAFTNAAAAATAAGQAQTTADGKNRVWYSNTAPPGTGHKVDDVWFDGANGNRINTWSGSAWVVRQMGTNAIANLSITNALIADATIQNAKIANLDAAKVTTGFLASARIAANSIDTTKLLIQGANLVPNPTFETLTGWTVAGGLTPNLTTTTRGRAVYFGRSVAGERSLTSQEIYIAAETTYTLGALVLRQSGSPEPSIRLEVIPVNNAGVDQAPVVIAEHGAGAAWTSIYGQYTMPASTYRSVKFRFVAGATSATTGNDYLIQPRMVQSSVGELIVDGAVKARHVEMETAFFDKMFGNTLMVGRVNVDHLAPNVGDNLNLSANGSITMIAGQQANMASDLLAIADEAADARSDASGALSVAQAASTSAAAANSAAAVADGKALAATTLAQNGLTGLAEQQSVFVITTNGAEVRSKDASSVVQIAPTGVAIKQGGVSVSQWDGARFISNEVVTNRAQLANHVVEKSGTRTVIRAL